MTINHLDATKVVAVAAAPEPLTRRTARCVCRAWQRGMATAEYAVGILAAISLALVLLKIFTHNDFFSVLLKFVVGLIGKASGMLP